MRNETAKLLKQLRAHGFVVSRTGKGHHKARGPDGQLVYFAATPKRSGAAKDTAKVKKVLRQTAQGGTTP